MPRASQWSRSLREAFLEVPNTVRCSLYLRTVTYQATWQIAHYAYKQSDQRLDLFTICAAWFPKVEMTGQRMFDIRSLTTAKMIVVTNPRN